MRISTNADRKYRKPRGNNIENKCNPVHCKTSGIVTLYTSVNPFYMYTVYSFITCQLTGVYSPLVMWCRTGGLLCVYKLNTLKRDKPLPVSV